MRPQQRGNAIQIMVGMTARQGHPGRAKAGRLAQVHVGDKQGALGGPEQHALSQKDDRAASALKDQLAVTCGGLLHAAWRQCCRMACRSFDKKLAGAALMIWTVGV